MSIKEQLVKAMNEREGEDLTAPLNTIFESVDINDELKGQFSTVFESVVNSQAVELATTLVEKAGEDADALVESHKKELDEAAEKHSKLVAEQMNEKVETYLEHVVDTWLAENKVAIENGIKLEMFENLVSGMKDMFVENNIVCPDDKIDVVTELEESVAELQEQVDKTLTESHSLRNELKVFQKAKIVESVTAGMADTQKEKVQALAESLPYSDDFENRLNTIIEFANGSKFGAITEAKVKPKTANKANADDPEDVDPEYKTDDEDEKEREKEQVNESVDPVKAELVARMNKLL